MGFKIKNSLTGEFEKLPILTLKGEKGETGGVEEYNKVDYMGNKYETLKQANDANVEYAVKTAIGEFNYLDYDGQHITATDTIAGQAKNAILTGQTLVNILNGDVSINENVPYYDYKTDIEFKANTVYTAIFKVESEATSIACGLLEDGGTWNGGLADAQNGYNKVLLTPSTTRTYGLRIRHFDGASVAINTSDVMLVEGDYTNIDIPYFEGMASVKAPVLHSVGKNLLSYNEMFVSPFTSATPYITKNVATFPFTLGVDGRGVGIKFKVEPNTTYTLSSNVVIPNTVVGAAFYKSESDTTNHNNKLGIAFSTNTEESTKTFTTPNECNWIVCGMYILYSYEQSGGKAVLSKMPKLQLEKNTQATPFEPYKSNILTTPEDLELRGIGDVKDTLNCNTGEMVERIGEIVYTGDENWKSSTMPETPDNIAFYLRLSNYLNNTNDKTMISLVKDNLGFTNNCLSATVNLPALNGKKGFSIHDNGNVYFTIPTSECANVSDWKNKLKEQPLVLQYAINPTVKTVDLSDNHVYSYKGTTHYDCSSAEGSLVPTLSVKVPTDVQATIAQQRETIQTLNSENERLNQIQEALKASMLDSQVQLMNISWNTDFEVFTLRESIAPKDFLLDSRIGSNIDKFSQAKFIIENDCPDLEKLNSQIEYYFSKDVFSQEQFEELTDLISIVKGENGCEY